MKNWHVALSSSFVRAMATEPRAFFRPLPDSFLMGALAAFSCMSAVSPPVWIMKLGMTRWKMRPS